MACHVAEDMRPADQPQGFERQLAHNEQQVRELRGARGRPYRYRRQEWRQVQHGRYR